MYESVMSVQSLSRVQLCHPMDCSTPSFPVHHQTPSACSDPCPLSQWCHPTISSSIIHFSFCLHSFPESGSFLKSQLFASGGQSWILYLYSSCWNLTKFILLSFLPWEYVAILNVKIFLKFYFKISLKFYSASQTICTHTQIYTKYWKFTIVLSILIN